MLISFIAQHLGYGLSEEEPGHILKFKDSLSFISQSLIIMKMTEPNGHEGYQFIEEEEEEQVPPLEQEPEHEAHFPIQGNDDQFEVPYV